MEEDKTKDILIFLQGGMSTEERRLFLQWIYDDKKNKDLYFKTKQVFDLLRTPPDIDPEISWTRLSAQIPPGERSGRFRLSGWLRYAAVILLAVTCTTSYFFLKSYYSTDVPVWYSFTKQAGKESVSLPDGSVVYVGPATTVSYDGNYGKKDRVIYLEGEACFEVARQQDKPFIVKTGRQQIEALGTTFNVMAYPGDAVWTTTLLEGSVRLITEGFDESVILEPDQQLVYHTVSNECMVKEVDASQVVMWVDGYYPFCNESLETILQRMGRVHGKTFIITNRQLADVTYTGTFHKSQSVEDLLNVIEVTVPIHYHRQGDIIYIQ